MTQHGGSPRILFHVFSMAGWSLFAVMLRDMAISGCAPRLRDVCGAVVDSAPQIAVRALLQNFYTSHVQPGMQEHKRLLQPAICTAGAQGAATACAARVAGIVLLLTGDWNTRC